LLAFFEQQGNATTNIGTDKRPNVTLFGTPGTTRVRSSFISVGKGPTPTAAAQDQSDQSVKPNAIAEPAQETENQKSQDAEDLNQTKIPVKDETKENAQPETAHVPQIEAPVEEEPKPLATEGKSTDPNLYIEATIADVSINDTALTTTLNEAEVPISPASSTPEKPPAATRRKSDVGPRKSIPALSPRTPPSPKRLMTTSPGIKSPPTPRKTPPQVKLSPPPKKAILGPLSPTQSISSRRSSSPFLVSPIGKSTFSPQKDSLPNPDVKSSPHSSPLRRESTPKSPPSTVKNKQRISPRNAKSTPKASPAPNKPSLSATPGNKDQKVLRPSSSLSSSSTPTTSRRVASQPQRPSTSASVKLPRLNRSASLHNLPRVKVTTLDAPPVPPIPRKRVDPPEDYGHLPAFMRPTQASAAKTVARSSSSMEKRIYSASFRV
jgi:hypothetical protein